MSLKIILEVDFFLCLGDRLHGTISVILQQQIYLIRGRLFVNDISFLLVMHRKQDKMSLKNCYNESPILKLPLTDLVLPTKYYPSTKSS